MGKQFTIIAPYSRVTMPNGRTYDAEDTVVLSDADYALLTAGMTRTFVEEDVTDVDDPVVPVEGAEAVTYVPAAGMTADNVQAALDELAGRVTALE